MTQVILSGNGACVEGALKVGINFYAGYPITPSSEIAEAMSKRLPLIGGKYIQMEDELGSMAALVGAALAGAKAMTATSGPGFSLMQENIGLAIMLETPCLIINAQRAGPSTGLATSPAQGDVMMARWGTHGDHPAIALSPWSVQESFDLTVKAVNLSERFRTPALLMSDAIVARVREKINIPDSVPVVSRPRPSVPKGQYKPYEAAQDGVPPMAHYGEGYHFYANSSTHKEDGSATGSNAAASAKLVERLHQKIYQHLDEILFTQELWLDDAEITIVSFGASARSALYAVKQARSKGIKAGMLRLITLWPFPDEKVKQVAQNSKAIIVAEMNRGQIVDKVREVGEGACEVHHVGRFDGEYLTPKEVFEKLEAVHGRVSRTYQTTR